MLTSGQWIAVGFAVVAAGGLTIVFSNNVRFERRIFWSSWFVGTAVMALAVTVRGWATAVLMFAVTAGLGVLIAYLRTPYLKVGGRIFSYTIARTQPDPPADGSPAPPVIAPPGSYRGVVTAATHWWSLTVFSAIAGVTTITSGMGREALAGTALVVTLLAFTGYLDAKDRFPIGRGQRVQCILIVIASVPNFLLPTVAYLIAYYIDRPARARHNSGGPTP
ncbi:hypothetical protein [Mycobacterium sp. C31M]